jgi:hypothetical protein
MGYATRATYRNGWHMKQHRALRAAALVFAKERVRRDASK